MNFILRKGAILIMIVLLAASCKEKYAANMPDFPPSKLDVLAFKFNGVVALLTDFGMMKDKIATLQKSIPSSDETTSIAVLRRGLNSIKSRTDSIVSALNKLAVNGTASRVLIDNLKEDLIALSLKVSADKEFIISQINSNGSTNVIQSYRLNELITSSNALVIQIANVQKTLNSLNVFSGDAATQVAVDVMVVQMNCVKVSFEILLATDVP